MGEHEATTQRSNLPVLDLEILRSFVAIAETGSYTKAAKQIYRTPAALSMQIKKLEEIVGKTLFRREPRFVRLTNDGEMLLGYSRRLLKLNEETVLQFIKPKIAGRISFGTTDDIGTRILPRVLSQFARSFPGIQVDVTISSSKRSLERLDRGDLDMALVIIGNDGEEIRGEVIHAEPLIWAGREGGIAEFESPLPLALANQGCVWRRMAVDALQLAGITHRVAYTCENSAAQEAAMISDLAISPFPKSLIRPPLKKISSNRLPPLGRYQTSLVRKVVNPETDALSSYIREAFKEFSTD